MRIKVTITGYYDVELANYAGAKTLQDCLRSDTENPNFGVLEIIDAIGDTLTVTLTNEEK